MRGSSTTGKRENGKRIVDMRFHRGKATSHRFTAPADCQDHILDCHDPGKGTVAETIIQIIRDHKRNRAKE
ncbi:MAG: hypothetical protein KAR42_17345 [candidate division Zixibacteria bacterium]|nr:hypothetical protein [candidate division Zixibacteria bacterium]